MYNWSESESIQTSPDTIELGADEIAWGHSNVDVYEYKKGKRKGKKAWAHYSEFGNYIKMAKSETDPPILIETWKLPTAENFNKFWKIKKVEQSFVIKAIKPRV